jgi:hypothetical protein
MPVFDWIKRFRRKCEDLGNEPPTAQNPETVSKIRELVARDRQVTKLYGGLTANKPRDVRQILHEGLGRGKICGKFLPRSLMDERSQIVKTCQTSSYVSLASILDINLGWFITILKNKTSEHGMD